MPELRWNEVDFLEYLEVSPQVDDYRTSYIYHLEQNGMQLNLSLWPFESVIQVALFRGGEQPLFRFAVYIRGAVQYVNDKRGRYLEFSDCIIAPNRFWYIDAGNVFDRKRFPVSLTIQVEVKPDIRVEFVPFESTT